ncbi:MULTISPECIES: hypothetical protein [Pseudomonas]|uniref:Uncharacterized protein n=1 Tax=Pseudomonas oryzihabitans TaxID=47885 RepID=A0A0U4WPU5_9PSED|nr:MULTISPECIES: hypothetical protein [Pseudomonas]ALZ84723.1 hypothetical protein APT59_11145 [Pseudomonas oryzihabitans]
MEQLKQAPFMISGRQPVPSAACEYEAQLLEAVRVLSRDDQQRVYLLVLDLARVSGPLMRKRSASMETDVRLGAK